MAAFRFGLHPWSKQKPRWRPVSHATRSVATRALDHVTKWVWRADLVAGWVKWDLNGTKVVQQYKNNEVKQVNLVAAELSRRRWRERERVAMNHFH